MEDDSETGCAKDNGNLNDKDDAVGKNGDIESKCTRKNGNLNDAINEFSNVVRNKNQEGSPELVDKDTDNLSAAYEELDIAANYWDVITPKDREEIDKDFFIEGSSRQTSKAMDTKEYNVFLSDEE